MMTPKERDRLDRTLALIPHGVCSGLEIGFNDMYMTAELTRRMDLVSIDLPRRVEADTSLKRAFANIAELPFPPASFDIVICTEVLEHLEQAVLVKGVAELQRVAGQYLLISVPFEQRVWNELSKCPQCGVIGNAMAHLHYFDEHKLLSLFPHATLIDRALIGTQHRYAPDVMYWLRSNVGNSWHRFEWGCKQCGAPPESIRPNAFGRAAQSVTWRWEALRGTKPSWIAALFAVNHDSASQIH